MDDSHVVVLLRCFNGHLISQMHAHPLKHKTLIQVSIFLYFGEKCTWVKQLKGKGGLRFHIRYTIYLDTLCRSPFPPSHLLASLKLYLGGTGRLHTPPRIYLLGCTALLCEATRYEGDER